MVKINYIPPVFSDSLPDSFGNKIIEGYLIAKGINIKNIDPLMKLQYIGNRGMGALEYSPKFDNIFFNETITLQDLQKLAELGNKKVETFESNIFLDDSISHILHLGGSAGGARPKAVIAINKNTGVIVSGQRKLDSNYEHKLIKIEGALNNVLGDPIGYGKLEYTYSNKNTSS